jgi:pilus assembly protein Flp/PilA
MLADHRGASAAEYAMILAIVGAGIAVAALSLGGSIADSMNNSSSNIRSCGGGC